MKTHRKRLLCLLAAALYLLLGTAVFADGTSAVPDGTGSIMIHMKDIDSGKPVPDGTLRCYQVAVPGNSLDGSGWAYTKPFAECKASLKELNASDLAYRIADYAVDNNAPGEEVKVSKDATVMFPALPAGLYLVIQSKASAGYSPFEPFLVTLPQNVDGKAVYDIDATPKLELKKEQTPPPAVPPGKHLPQTGQLWWPVAVLAAAGIILIVLGVKTKKRCEAR